MKINKKFLKKYLNSYSPSGFEYELGGQKLWVEEMTKYAKTDIDIYGSAYSFMGNLDSDFTVLIDSHSDEIAFSVNYIDPKGFIRVSRLGGSDSVVAPQSRVYIFTQKGDKIPGVFGYPAIHIKGRKDKVELDDLFIDVGASNKEEVDSMGIAIGDTVVYQDGLMELGKNFYTGRALDNRISAFVLTEIARIITEEDIKLPFKLVLVNSVLEEVGLYGAKGAHDRIQPNVAIVLDTGHETSAPGYNAQKEGEIVAGRGPNILMGPTIHKKLRKIFVEIANNCEIPYQVSTFPYASGTNLERYVSHNTACVGISLPTRYLHTSVETLHKDDLVNTIDLVVKTLSVLKGKEDIVLDI